MAPISMNWKLYNFVFSQSIICLHKRTHFNQNWIQHCLITSQAAVFATTAIMANRGLLPRLCKRQNAQEKFISFVLLLDCKTGLFFFRRPFAFVYPNEYPELKLHTARKLLPTRFILFALILHYYLNNTDSVQGPWEWFLHKTQKIVKKIRLCLIKFCKIFGNPCDWYQYCSNMNQVLGF